MNKTVVIVVVAALVVLGGVLALTKKSSAPSSSNNSSSNQNEASSTPETSNNGNGPAAEVSTITYTDEGFSPASLTVKSGSKITVKNNSSNSLQFDSDPHPEHTANPELNVGQISPGESKTFTATKTGSHGYHNHLRSSDTGTLVVQ